MFLAANISKATKDNWDRLGSSPEDRLTKRANKQLSQKTIVPVEYLTHPSNIFMINNLLDIINNHNINISSAIYSLSINLLKSLRMIQLDNDQIITSNNPHLKDILDSFRYCPLENSLIDAILPLDEVDLLGVVYQSLLQEGQKNKTGSYYTPQKIITSLKSQIQSNHKLLDPCCGSGSFLLNFADRIENPKNIYGIDTDFIACFIAKVNLIIAYKHIIFNPNIYNLDFLTLNTDLYTQNPDFQDKFDIIATNPPWGANFANLYKSIFSTITSKESFSYFIAKSSSFLSKNGLCCFILPTSILNVATHADIRKYILEKFNINKIELLGQIFKGVLTNVIQLILSQKTPQNQTEIIYNKCTNYIYQSTFEKNINYNFTLYNNTDIKLLEKIYNREYKTLSESIWALGIVTGDNKKHISKQYSHGKENIYTGKEISPFIVKESSNYIEYIRTNFQQVASDEVYRVKEKIVYKFISKKLVFSYDDKQRLFLNSANIIVPSIKDYSIKTCLALLNSRVFQYIYIKKFNEIKILKGNLLQLPFPTLSKNKDSEIKELVNNYLISEDSQIINSINNKIYEIFNLNKNDISIIESELKNGKFD